MMSTSEIDSEPSQHPVRSLTLLHLIGLLLAGITGGIHLWLGITESSPALFIAGVGFAVGIVAVVGDIRRSVVVKLGIPFTATQTVYYFGTHFDEVTQLGATDKLVQAGLVGILLLIIGVNE